MKCLAQTLLTLRKSKELSQSEVIRLSKIGKNQLYLIENGKIVPKIETLIKLCEVYKISLSELFREAKL